VCLTLGEIPFIRFDTTGPNNLFARTVGEMLEMHLKKAVAGLGDAFKQSNRSERSTLLILDRSSDNVTPLMHEFTYQAVLHDMMDIQGEIVTVPDTDKAAEGETKTIVLSEDDKLWNDLRHSHIATVSDTVRDKLRDLMGNSAAAKFTSAKNMTHKELMKVVQERPQFQAMTAMFRKHVELNRLAMATARTDKYLAMGEWEQDLATGKNAENKNVTSSALKAELASICNDPTVTVVEKLRLLMLFTIAHGGLTDAMRTTLMEETSPRISSGLQKAFLNLQHLGVDLHAKKPVAKKKPKNKPKRTFLGLLGITDSAAQELKTGKYGATLRYSPPLKNIASNLMNNKLDPDDFPFVNKADAKHSKSTKNTRFNFRRPTKSKTVKKDMRTRKILFVLGGVTFSELRSAYEVMADPHTEKDNILYIGGNELLTPSSFLEQLSELSPKAFAKQASVSGVSYAAKSTAVHDTDLDGIQLEYSDED
jgi:hypothetical protein